MFSSIGKMTIEEVVTFIYCGLTFVFRDKKLSKHEEGNTG